MKKYMLLFIFLATLGGLYAQELKIGDKAPEIIQKMPNGEELKLSSLKGQLVLIDFWASWCKPCRKENPKIVAAYKKYKDAKFKNGSGFTVLSVSMDLTQNAWERSIEQDNLIWPYHVSDLKGWKNDAAIAYQVKSIPASFLIDGEGTIVAINLRGSKLEATLKKLKKGFLFF